MKPLICDNCGEVKEKVTFWIGASRDPHPDDAAGGWVMHEGTGRVSCPKCHPVELARATLAIEKYTGIKERG